MIALLYNCCPKKGDIQTRVCSLEKQVRTLKKMLMLSVFKDKQEMRDFFNDVW